CDRSSTTFFVLRSDVPEVAVFRVPYGDAAISATAKHLRRALNGAPEEFPPYPPLRRDRPFDRKLTMLDDVSSTLTAFLPALDGVQLVCCAPHGPLHLLPLHALRTSDGRWLSERHAFSYAPSLTIARSILARSSAQRPSSFYVAGIAASDDS